MNRRLLLIPTAVAASLGAAAPRWRTRSPPTPPAPGLTLSMPRTEDGTVVDRLGGAVVRTDARSRRSAAGRLTLASPDQDRQHTWVGHDRRHVVGRPDLVRRPSRRARPGPRRRLPARKHDIPATLPARVGRAGVTVGTDVPPRRRVPPWSPSLARRFHRVSELPATGRYEQDARDRLPALVAAGSAAALIARRRAS